MTAHALAQLAYLAAACAAAALTAAALRRHGAVVLRHRRPDLPLPPELHARLVAQGLGLVAQGVLAAAVVLQPVAADAAQGLRAVSIMLGAALLALGVLNYGALAQFARARREVKVLLPIAKRREPSGCFIALTGAVLAFGFLLVFAVVFNGWRGVGQLLQIVGVLLGALVALLLIPGFLVAALIHAAGAPEVAAVAGGAVAEILFWFVVVARVRARNAARPLNTRFFERRAS